MLSRMLWSWRSPWMPDEARARLAVRSRRFVTRKFSLERMGDATMHVYRELLEGLAPDAEHPVP